MEVKAVRALMDVSNLSLPEFHEQTQCEVGILRRGGPDDGPFLFLFQPARAGAQS